MKFRKQKAEEQTPIAAATPPSEDEKHLEDLVVEHEHGEPMSEEEVRAIMSQYDKESNTRAFVGTPKFLARWACILFTLYVIAINTIWLLPMQATKASFVGFIVLLVFIFYPARKRDGKKKYVPWYDWLLGLIGAACYFYFVFNLGTIAGQMGTYTTQDYIIAIVGILILFECCRRVVGLPLMIVVACFLAYAYFGKYIPGSFGHNGYTVKRLATFLFYTNEGVIGTPTQVCVAFVFVFILFGAFLEKTGVGKFFIDVANSIAGKAVGGPAKVAVIASALQGTISGSSVANTVGSGSFTIPMMKRMGYRPHFAAAVEAVSSTGGQLMPPIMGAAAFLMAEITGIPYATIILAAVIPSILYFSSVMIMVHFEARKLGLQGMPADEVPNFWKLMKQNGHLILPLIAIVYFLASGNTPGRAALYAVGVAIVVSMFRKETRLNITRFFDALENGTRNSIGVAVACAMAGMIVGVVTLTGLGITFAASLQTLSGGITLFALFFCMIASIVLGMGVPTTANYVIMATVTAPIVMQLGVPMIAAHMFVFYFGIIADITPPVALAAYAGSAIAKSDPLRTGVTASKLGIAAFLVPYIFAFNPEMLFYETNALEVIQIAISGFCGVAGIAAALEGYVSTRLYWFERIICAGGGLMLVIPGLVTDLAGIALVGTVFVIQYRRNKKGQLQAAL